MLKYVLAWFPMVAIAIANGALRELWYGKFTTELRAHQISTLAGCTLFGMYIWGVMRFWKPTGAAQAIYTGIVWVVLTICFEFIFGRFVAGHSWRRLLHDYNILAGRVWVLALIWLGIAPYLFYRMQ